MGNEERDLFERRLLVLLEVGAEPAGGEASVALRLLPCDQCRQLRERENCKRCANERGITERHHDHGVLQGFSELDDIDQYSAERQAYNRRFPVRRRWWQQQ